MDSETYKEAPHKNIPERDQEQMQTSSNRLGRPPAAIVGSVIIWS
jgi:hypothetical protein